MRKTEETIQDVAWYSLLTILPIRKQEEIPVGNTKGLKVGDKVIMILKVF